MKQVKELLAKEMTRKEFLRLFGLGLLSAFGVSNFISYLLKNARSSAPAPTVSKVPASSGFGSRTFGS